MEHARIADAALPARRQRRGGAANLVADRIKALSHRARGDDEALGVHVAGLDGVAAAQFEPVHAQPVGQLVHLAFHGEGRFQVAVAAHRSRVGIVRVDDRRVEPHAGTAIEPGHRGKHHVRRRRAPGDVRAVVDGDVGVTGEQPAVGRRRRAQPDRARLARRTRDELLHTVEFDLHRAAGAAREQRGDDVDRVEIEAPPEVATDGRLEHPHAITADAEGVGEIALVEERHLGGAPHRQPPLGVPVRDGDHGSETGRRDEVQRVLTLDDGGRVGPRAVDVAVRELVAERRDVGPYVLVDERRARSQGGRRGEHGRQLVVLDLDQRERLFGEGGRLGGDRGDLVADAPDLAALEREMILDEAERMLLDVGSGDDADDAGQGARARRVDANDAGVRQRGPQDPAVQHPRQLEVVEEARPPGDLLGAVLLRGRPADDAQITHARWRLTRASRPAAARRAGWSTRRARPSATPRRRASRASP